MVSTYLKTVFKFVATTKPLFAFISWNTSSTSINHFLPNTDPYLIVEHAHIFVEYSNIGEKIEPLENVKNWRLQSCAIVIQKESTPRWVVIGDVSPTYEHSKR